MEYAPVEAHVFPASVPVTGPDRSTGVPSRFHSQ
jgi:hypothetical protein